MAAKTVAILGGGWGGLAAAHDLRGLLPEEHRIVVVERSEHFSLCLSNLWLMTGERAHLNEVRRDMSKLARPGIEWVNDEVEGIDPKTRTVQLRSGPLTSDYLVIALGAERDLGAVPGLAACAYNLYDATSAAALRPAVSGLSGGHVVLVVAGTPFSCPAAPYEAAFVIEHVLRNNGARGRTDIRLYTPEPMPMPVAGPVVGEQLSAMLAEREIAYHPQRTVVGVDEASRTIHFGTESAPFDLLVAIPRHHAPRVVTEAALTDTTGYIPVHPQTLEILSDPDTLQTHYPCVFAIGDVTSIRLLNSKLLPKAGVFVEAQARVVAANIAADIRGEQPRARFTGQGFCYIEVGNGLAAYGSGNFFAYPAPTVTLEPPSHHYKVAKEELERVLETWFH